MKNKNNRIVVFSNSAWSIFNFRISLIKKLIEKNFDVIIVSPKDKYVENLKSLGCDYYSINLDRNGKNIFKEIFLLLKIFILFYRIHPKYVLQFTIKPNIYGSIVTRMLGIKTINNITGLGTFFEKDNALKKFILLLYKFSFKKVQKVFFQNIDDKNIFLDEKIILSCQSAVLPGSGVNVKEFIPVDREANKNLVFLMICRLIKSKGVYNYVEAAKIIKEKYPNVTFNLVGNYDLNKIDSITEEEIYNFEDKGYIKYLGFTDDIKSKILQSDCIVLPSYYNEGTPRSLIESASMGKAIITTNHKGCRDVVEDSYNGYLCEAKNSKDLAKKIEKFINLSEDSKLIMSKNSRNRALTIFDEQIIIKKYLLEILD